MKEAELKIAYMAKMRVKHSFLFVCVNEYSSIQLILLHCSRAHDLSITFHCHVITLPHAKVLTGQ